jgi:TrpR-related protein YerC/YecD
MTYAAEVDLYNAFLCLRTVEEVESFFQDLFSADEIDRFVKRWQVFSLDAKGLTKAKIQAQMPVSGATISRARRVCKSGTGMVKVILERLAEEESEPWLGEH